MTRRDRAAYRPDLIDPDLRRLFVAVPLPETAREAVAAIVGAVRAQPLPEGMRDVRWVRLDGLHVTMRFLGPTPPEREAPTVAAMERAAAAAPPGEGRLAGSGAFPRHGRPRTLWIGIDGGVDTLGAIAATLGRELEAAGWPHDDRPFRAHLTLARSDGLVAGPLVATRLAAAMGDAEIPFTIERLILYESVTGGGPARYVPVSEASLGGST